MTAMCQSAVTEMGKVVAVPFDILGVYQNSAKGGKLFLGAKVTLLQYE